MKQVALKLALMKRYRYFKQKKSSHKINPIFLTQATKRLLEATCIYSERLPIQKT